MQNQIKNGRKLLDGYGCLTQHGWSDRHMLHYRRKYIKHHFLRTVESDCYYIASRKCALYIIISDCTLRGSISVVLVDFEKGTVKKSTRTKLFSLGRMKMPTSPDVGTTVFSDSHCGASFASASDKKFIKCDFVDFFDSENLYINLTLQENTNKAMFTARDIPAEENSRYFLYNCFKPAMSVSGVVRCGGDEYIFSGERNYAFLNWSRGVIPKEMIKQNLYANGYLAGKRQFALCLSDLVKDSDGVSENALFCRNKINKLENVKFESENSSPLSPRRISEDSHGVLMSFKPLEGRCGILRATLPDRLVIFGKIEGEAIPEDDSDIYISRLPAIMEIETY